MPSTIVRTLPLLLTALAVHANAQSVSPAWESYRGSATPPAQNAQPAASQSAAAAPTAYTAPVRDAREARGGFFLGAQAGQGWVYEDIDQDAVSVNAGYRWQAGPYVLVGVELNSGVLRQTEDSYYIYPKVRYAGIGANTRINFGRSPWFALARLGYFDAEADNGYDDTFDGAYGSLGIGVDAGEHVNFSLVYTGFFYASSYYYPGYNYSVSGTEVNRADMVTLGVEVRF